MVRRTFFLIGLASTMLWGIFIVQGCTDLQEGAEVPGVSVADLGTADGSALEATSTLAPAVTTSTTIPSTPGTTTTTTGSSPSSVWQFEPGLLQTEISAIKIDPNNLVAPTRYEDTHPYLHWEGSWNQQTDPAKYSGGSQRATHVENDYVEVFFKGTGVRLVASKSIQGADIRIVLTGNGTSKVEKISLYSATPLNQQKVWYSGHLTYGDYAVYFEHDPANSGFKVVWVDAIDVWGTVTPP